MKKPVLDILDLNSELERYNKNLETLQSRFVALGLDYTHYIDNSINQKEIFELRDGILYRFFSAGLHMELLIRQHFIIEKRFEGFLATDPIKLSNDCIPVNPYFEHAEKEISSIFDSFLYHIVSIFDYMGTLSNYICGKQNQDTLTWMQLKRSCNDSTNHFGKKKLAETIKMIDNNFASKLYDYRSNLIHRKAEFNRYSFSLVFGETNKVNARFIASEKMTKHFQELKKLSETNYLTTKYVAFWIANKTTELVSQILFALREEMQSNAKVSFGLCGFYDEKTRRLLPASTMYWLENK